MIVKRTKGAAIVPAEALKNRDISLRAKGLFAYLLLMEDLSYVTVKGISMELRESEESVASAMAELEATGYVEDPR